LLATPILSTYFGRITNDGTFIPVKKRKPRGKKPTVEELNSQIEELKTKISELQKEGPKETIVGTREREFSSKYERPILTALSMNGRIPYSVLKKMVNLGETATIHQVRRLEKKYNIKYLAEIDVSKLGYLQFLITVKFTKGFPKASELKDALFKEPRIQLALVTEGEYNLIMYALAKDSKEINRTIINLRINLDYESSWTMSPIEEDYCFIPLREGFVGLLKEDLKKREYAVLKELNDNGTMEFTEIDEKYGFDKGASQYSFYKLKESGIIKRITISMKKLPIKYIGMIFIELLDYTRVRMNRSRLLSNFLEYKDQSMINKYILIDDIFAPQNVVLYLPIFGYGELERASEEISELNLGAELKTATVTNILMGDFCYRRFDNAYSIQQEILEKEYGFKPVDKIDYEETGRHKKLRINYKVDIRGVQIGKEES
jgi:DNA-binding Lrp family transcriptional regulator